VTGKGSTGATVKIKDAGRRRNGHQWKKGAGRLRLSLKTVVSGSTAKKKKSLRVHQKPSARQCKGEACRTTPGKGVLTCDHSRGCETLSKIEGINFLASKQGRRTAKKKKEWKGNSPVRAFPGLTGENESFFFGRYPCIQKKKREVGAGQVQGEKRLAGADRREGPAYNPGNQTRKGGETTGGFIFGTFYKKSRRRGSMEEETAEPKKAPGHAGPRERKKKEENRKLVFKFML